MATAVSLSAENGVIVRLIHIHESGVIFPHAIIKFSASNAPLATLRMVRDHRKSKMDPKHLFCTDDGTPIGKENDEENLKLDQYNLLLHQVSSASRCYITRTQSYLAIDILQPIPTENPPFYRVYFYAGDAGRLWFGTNALEKLQAQITPRQPAAQVQSCSLSQSNFPLVGVADDANAGS
jgi:hypothetical protein